MDDHHLPHPPPEPSSSSTDVAVPNPPSSPSPKPILSKKKKNKDSQSSSSSTSSHNFKFPRIKRRVRIPGRTPVSVSGSIKQKGLPENEDIDALALPLGMAFAAVIAQVLERKDTDVEKLSADHLSVICSSAVKESLSYVFGYSFDSFGRNFERSFLSTLQTLRLVNESSQASVGGHVKYWTRGRSAEMAPRSTYKQDDSACSSICETRRVESVGCTNDADIQPEILEDTEVGVLNKLSLRRSQNDLHHSQNDLHHSQSDQQLACVSSSNNIFNSDYNQSMITTYKKSVLEQSRSNDLKEVELALVQKRMQLEEKQLDLMTEANSLGRSKLSMSYSMASFKAGKFKIELEDTRRAELLRQCIDCLVFGLVVMLSCLGYGIYIFSFERITEATSACTPSMESSWWKPQAVTNFNSALQSAWCYTQTLSRIMFAILMIIAIMYLLIQRSSSSNQTMPLTFIILILGIAVGIVGKLCIDTLGGSGYHWLLQWEVICFFHFLSIFWTNILHRILYGPVTPFEHVKSKILSPYVIRRILYYVVMLLVLPLLCGLLPFASFGEWRDHFSSLFLRNDFN